MDTINYLLNNLKSNIDANLKFKREYNKQLALDFSLFQFFGIGEVKISEVIAFFLDVNQNHGQGDIFLKEFVKTFYGEINELVQHENVCEKIIDKNRRIDIYLRLNDLTIAIENKIWADDQDNQLKDYSEYLERNTAGKYKLFYLNPYGNEPTTKSIDDDLKNSLLEQNKFKVIGYKQDIIPLINRWILLCDADTVSHFLKEFKKHLEVKFLGKKILNMSKELREIILKNEREVLAIVDEFKAMENEVINKINSIGKKLDNIAPTLSEGITLGKSGLFNWNGMRVYKYSIAKGGNKIWIQLVKDQIHLLSNYYLQEGTDPIFNNILHDLEINNGVKINHKHSDDSIITTFLQEVEKASRTFAIYENID